MGLVDLSTNPRPKRLIQMFSELGFSVSAASFSLSNELPVHCLYEFRQPSTKLIDKIFRKLIKLFLIIFFKSDFLTEKLHENRWGFNSVKNDINNCHYDYIFVEDINLLAFAFKIKKTAKIIFDAREYYPKEFESNFLWRILEQQHRIQTCKKYLHHCNAVMTVSNGLAKQYFEDFQIMPYLIRSTPYFAHFQSQEILGTEIRMVHHGIANWDRKLENIIDTMNYLDERFSLDFYLNGDNSYVKYLKNKAKRNPRIRFNNPVPLEDIIPTVNNYDIGVCFLYPNTFNLKHCFPNKLFECIQARLAVVIGPSPDMKEIVEQYKCGFICEDFDSKNMAKMLNKLTKEDIYKAKLASGYAAKELCYEEESKKIINLLNEINLQNNIGKAA